MIVDLRELGLTRVPIHKQLLTSRQATRCPKTGVYLGGPEGDRSWQTHIRLIRGHELLTPSRPSAATRAKLRVKSAFSPAPAHSAEVYSAHMLYPKSRCGVVPAGGSLVRGDSLPEAEET